MQLQGTVYIDSIFLLNLVMDFYLLTLTGKVLGKTATYSGIFAGSVIGALGYCIVLCLPGIPYILKIPAGMLPTGALMVKLGCRTKGKKELVRAEGYLFLFSFLMGGFIIFLKVKIPLAAEHGDSMVMIAGLGFVGFVIFRKLMDAYRKRKEDHFCRVFLQGDHGPCEIMALIDTGNGLVEPISKKPVAVLEEKQWENLKGWMKPEKFKLIPYHSIGRENGMLEGYEIDLMEVKGKTGEKQFDKVIVAVFRGKISQKGGYQMILPPELSI